MRTLKSVGWVCAVAALGGGITGCKGKPHEDEPDRTEHARLCAKKHPVFPRPKTDPGDPNGGKGGRDGTPQQPKAERQPSGPRPMLAAAFTIATIGGGDDCPSSGCGQNGVWLGDGVPFRTLHLSRFRHNEVNLAILQFQGPPASHGQRENLTLKVDGDVLHPEHQPIVQAGSRLLLGPPETPDGPRLAPTYALTITKVHDSDFWVARTPGSAPEKFPVYEFSATDLTNDCPVQVCEPGLDSESDTTNNLFGTAVIFRGDYYDEAYTVRITPPTDYDDDVFNISCNGTDLSKLHRFRHTSAAKILPGDPPPPPVDERQTLLRLLSADYCGAGHPFTHNGVPLNLAFDPMMGFNSATASMTPGSGFRLTPPFAAHSVEAMWDKNGATCIGDPRLGTSPEWRAKIKETCRLFHRTVPDCVMPPDPPGPASLFTAPFQLGSYAISQNPF